MVGAPFFKGLAAALGLTTGLVLLIVIVVTQFT